MARPRPYLHSTAPRLTNSAGLPTHDSAGCPLIRLQTLGAAVIMVGDVRLSPAAGTLFSLLVRLSGAPGMMLSRDVLRRLLWADQEEVRQRANLRQALYKLRSYGVRVSMEGDVVILDESQVVASFTRTRTVESFERDVTLGHEPFGPFLPGFVVPWPEFQEWIEAQREAVHAEVRRVLIEQLRRRRERADWGGAHALARWLLQFDPLNEEATLTIAECAVLSGSKTEALAILDRYLAELGPTAGDIRLPATMLRKRIAEPASRGRRSFAPTERHFVGRADELASLTLAMRRARWHDGSAVLLHGPPGIGKSRLAHELDKVAALEGVRVVQASCRESDLLRPLSVFLDVLPEIMNASGALGCAPESLAALRRLVPSAHAPEALVEGVVGVKEPMPMASSLRRAIIDVLAAVSDEKPVLLIVEDVHWIDEHSWDVLADLIDRAGAMRVFLLLTSRDAHARPQRPQRVPLSLSLHRVPPLSAESCLQLSRAIGEDLSAPIDDALGEWFVRASEGIPLFLRALVNYWIETGEAGGVPPTLQGLIEQRLSQLSGDALRVLQTAALLGKWATCERVQDILGIQLREMLSCLDQLSQIEALKESPAPSLEAHFLIRRVALGSMTTVARRMLCASVAAALSRNEMFPHESCEIDIVDRFVEAGEVDRAMDFVLSALRTLLDLDLPHRALAVSGHVIGVVPQLADQTSFQLLRRNALFSAGQYAGLLLDFAWNVDVPVSPSTWDSEHARDVVRMVEVGDRAMFVGDFADLCARGLLIANATHIEPRLRLRAAIAVIRAASMGAPAAMPNAAYEIGHSIVQLFADSGDGANELDMYFHTTFGDYGAAASAARRLLATAATRRTSSDEVRVLGDCAFALMCAGELTEASARFQQTFERAIEVDVLNRAASARFNQSLIAIASDRLDLAQQLGHEGLRIAVTKADPFLESLCHRNLSRISLLTGDLAGATRHYESSNELGTVAAHPKWRAFDVALKLGLAIAANDERDVRQLLSFATSELRALWNLLGQDFLASRVSLALSMTTGSAAATVLMREYTNFYRREAYPLPLWLDVGPHESVDARSNRV